MRKWWVFEKITILAPFRTHFRPQAAPGQPQRERHARRRVTPMQRHRVGLGLDAVLLGGVGSEANTTLAQLLAAPFERRRSAQLGAVAPAVAAALADVRRGLGARPMHSRSDVFVVVHRVLRRDDAGAARADAARAHHRCIGDV